MKYRLLLLISITICALQIWLPDYYLTGDGPTHLYNANMLKDYWTNSHQSFYKLFYKINADINPNWSGHVILAILMFIFSPVVAEKILFSIYILIFISGFYKLIKFTGSSKYLIFIAFCIVFTHTLAKGFFNFNFSIALSIWMIWAWCSILLKSGVWPSILFFLLSCATYITHPLGFAYATGACVFITIPYIFLSKTATTKQKFQIAFVKFSTLLLCILPPLCMLWLFNAKQGSGLVLTFDAQRLPQLMESNDYLTYTTKENFWAVLMRHLLLLPLILLSILSIRLKWLNERHSGILLFIPFMFVLYTFVPDYLAGGGLVVMRSRQLFFMTVAIGIILMGKKNIVQVILGYSFLILFIGISAARLPVLIKIGKANSEYLSVAEKIPPESVVMPVSFSHNGKDINGNLISDCNWIFQHAAGYLGGAKPLILLENYEAHTNYFPFMWYEYTDPYKHLDAEVGIESQPPGADIPKYEESSGQDINYIMTWCYDSSSRTTPHVDDMMSYIEENYEIVIVSNLKRAALYRKKSLYNAKD